MKKIILMLFLYPLLVFGQGRYSGNTSDATALCKIRVDAANSFSSNKDAEFVLQKIITVTGIAKRFALYQCNGIMNCEALTYRGIRYIFYDSDFMKAISNKSGSSWTNISILAHEVGHHVNGHALDWLSYQTGEIGGISLAEKRKQEIEADEFSGFVLYKLGATLYQAQAAINKFGFDGDDSYSTHPNKTKRLAAIKRGYNKGKNTNTIETKELTAEDYFYKAFNAPYNSHQYKIDNYNICINLNYKKEWTYTLRGMEKGNLKDYYGAISDFSKAIEFDPNFLSAYCHRGIQKEDLGDYKGAIVDYSKSIEIDPSFVLSYYRRARAKRVLKDYEGAIDDLSKAIELDPNFYSNYIVRGEIKRDFEDYEGAIDDFSKAIEIKINEYAYLLRGGVKSTINDYEGAIDDFSKVIEIDSKYQDEEYVNDELAYYSRGIAKFHLNDYYGAIADFSECIEQINKRSSSFKTELKGLLSNCYFVRGYAKSKIKPTSACPDYKKACALGSSEGCAKYNNNCP